MNRFALISLLVINLYGCSTPVRTNELPTSYFIRIDPIIEGESLKLNGTTNLPDNSKVLVEAGREFFQIAKTDTFIATYHEEDVEVQNGQFHFECNLNRQKLEQEWRKEAIEKANVGVNPISRFSDTLEISAMFSPRRQKNEGVLKQVGKNGESLRGTQVEKKFAFSILKADTAFNFK